MLRDAALLELELLLAALDENLILKDASPYNVQWRARGRCRRRRLLRAAPRGRALGRLPPVLHAPALPAHAPGLQERSVPAVAPRVARGIEPAEMRRLLSFRDRFRRGVLTNVVLHEARGPLRRPRGEARSEEGRVPHRADPRQRPQAPQARPAARVEARRTAWSTYRTTNPYDEPDAAAKLDFVREAAGAATAGSSGISAATTAASRAWRRWTPTTRWPWTPTPPSSRRSTGSCARTASTRSSRSSATWPTPPPGLGAERSGARSSPAAART